LRLAAVLLALTLLTPAAVAQQPAPDRAAVQREAEAGDAEAAFMLGRMYLDGVGGDEDRAEARIWLAKAATAGHVRASVLLGLMLMAGQGGGADRDAARPLLLYAGAAGDSTALYHLGVLFAEGRSRDAGGPEQSAARAVFWFRQAALAGNVDGMSNLGLMLLRGLGTPRDPAEAYVWYLKAAEAGDAQSQFVIATMLYEGQGVAADPKAALMWYFRAKANGIVDDAMEVDLLKKLSEADIADAKRLAGDQPTSP
jgi:TPR repeat protein